MVRWLSAAVLVFLFSASVSAVEYEDHDKMLMDHGDGHLMDMGGGMVMGQNTSTLPGGCDSIAESKEITVHAGHKYAEKFPGRMFAFDTQEYNFKPCTKLTIHFINDDHIRHQWMMHGLPKYIYPKGMFHLEVSGPGKISGTLILPPGDKTYLVHCDIAQHMEKGMKGQLKVGKGDGDLPSIPGVTAYVISDDYKGSLSTVMADVAKAAEALSSAPVATNKNKTPAAVPQMANEESMISGVTVIGVAIGLFLAPFLAKKFRGMSAPEIVATIFSWMRIGIDQLLKWFARLLKLVIPNKDKALPEN